MGNKRYIYFVEPCCNLNHIVICWGKDNNIAIFIFPFAQLFYELLNLLSFNRIFVILFTDNNLCIASVFVILFNLLNVINQAASLSCIAVFFIICNNFLKYLFTKIQYPLFASVINIKLSDIIFCRGKRVYCLNVFHDCIICISESVNRLLCISHHKEASIL